MGNIFTVQSGLPFVDVLVDYLIKKNENNKLGLADYTVVLPTNRSVRALKEAFLRKSDGEALLLPRITTINMLPFAFDKGNSDDGLTTISDFSRQFLLAKMIKMIGKEEYSDAKSLALSSSLLNVLDDFIDNDISFLDLEKIVPDNFAKHWSDILVFLKIITENWNDILKEKGFIDGKVSFNKKIEEIISSWHNGEWKNPVVLAGLSYVSPMVKKLFLEVLRLDNGEIVFYGLDNKISKEEYELLLESHPQFSFKKLLKGSGINFFDVKDLQDFKENHRLDLLKEAMKPSEIVHTWNSFKVNNEAFNNLFKVECQDIDNEADIISLILRKTLETEGKTAIVVTPNHNLTKMIKSKMKRWDIILDDSSGYGLNSSKIGIFFFLLIKYAENVDNRIVLLELLKHPFCLAGINYEEAVRHTRLIERESLRGKNEVSSLREISETLNDGEAKNWVLKVLDILSPFLDAFKNEKYDFGDLLKLHVKTAENLASLPDNSMNLWKFNEGEVASNLLFEVIDSAKMVGKINLREYAEFFSLIMRTKTVRPLYGMHPRLDILSPIESRLQGADTIIISGLNEETWIKTDDYNPWLNRNMKKALGLLTEDFETGLTSLDFINLMSGKEVYLTRSLKDESTATNPSRWLLRTEALLEANSLKMPEIEKDFFKYLKHFYEPENRIEISEPRPCPDISLRPKRLSVSDFRSLWHDPYSIYAKHILKLRPLDDLKIEVGGKEFGTAIHKVLELYYDADEKTLLQKGKEILEQSGINGGFWHKKFEKFIFWYASKQEEDKDKIFKTFTENKGNIVIDDFEITAKADRIDMLKDGTVRIVDYKTSSRDLKKEAMKDFEPQLPIEAMISKEGGFKNFPKSDVSSLEYWQTDSKEGGEVKELKEKDFDIDDFIQSYFENSKDLITYFKSENAVYLSDKTGKSPYSDYKHLARFEEWSGGDDDE